MKSAAGAGGRGGIRRIEGQVEAKVAKEMHLVRSFLSASFPLFLPLFFSLSLFGRCMCRKSANYSHC